MNTNAFGGMFSHLVSKEDFSPVGMKKQNPIRQLYPNSIPGAITRIIKDKTKPRIQGDTRSKAIFHLLWQKSDHRLGYLIFNALVIAMTDNSNQSISIVNMPVIMENRQNASDPGYWGYCRSSQGITKRYGIAKRQNNRSQKAKFIIQMSVV